MGKPYCYTITEKGKKAAKILMKFFKDHPERVYVNVAIEDDGSVRIREPKRKVKSK